MFQTIIIFNFYDHISTNVKMMSLSIELRMLSVDTFKITLTQIQDLTTDYELGFTIAYNFESSFTISNIYQF